MPGCDASIHQLRRRQATSSCSLYVSPHMKLDVWKDFLCFRPHMRDFLYWDYSQKQAHSIFQYLPPQCLQFMLSPFKTFQCSSLHICRKFRAINSALAKDMHFFFYYSASSILVSTESKCISPIGSWDRVAKVNGYLVVG